MNNCELTLTVACLDQGLWLGERAQAAIVGAIIEKLRHFFQFKTSTSFLRFHTSDVKFLNCNMVPVVYQTTSFEKLAKISKKLVDLQSGRLRDPIPLTPF
ncbi:Hypothetical protein PAS_chr1-4_0554 [Komagataella phaffii GS115]|uniref:Uncharacterized protein n=1 Tax=Komagataella phaffii (strain GS115 / ATCC 20864) TaxID=644223 RepID=C4QYT6_KOMPG|nr:Hypothetical protein PAS_chr1-4_0554 [Komagataella phaffii GS115]CAY68410.1 Hypothetical protein PAS_chr1-4_0554 [Komagataella phaffii GS115]